jgi:transposase
MADARQKALADVRRAQARFERLQTQLEGGRESRRQSFKRARAVGLSLAEIAGHRVETMLARYTHAVGQSFGAVRAAIEQPSTTGAMEMP